MIVEPLKWLARDRRPDCLVSDSPRLGAYEVDRRQFRSEPPVFAAVLRKGGDIGLFDSSEQAIAACDHHNQVATVRGLTAAARAALRHYAESLRWPSNQPDAVQAVRWLSIINEAEQL